jgi:hypothetical protein
MSTTVFCEACGAGIESTANFCVQCGSAQAPTGASNGRQLAPVGLATSGNGGPAPSPASPLASDVDAAPAITPASSHTASAASAAPPAPASAAARGYTICAIREVADDHGNLEEGLLYPVGLEGRDTVAVEARDGSRINRLNCTAIDVAPVGAKQTLLRVKDISAQVMLTDARVTVACTKYDKGGGWRGWGIGGVALSLPLNAASHALAARRRRGKMLVGQVRYPWISGVYAQSRVGFGGTEKLRVIASVSGGKRLRIDLTFPKDIDACAVGTELIRRTAAFRLTHDDAPLAEDVQRRLRELAAVAPLKFVKGSGQMAGHQFPTCWPASERSARFGLS